MITKLLANLVNVGSIGLWGVGPAPSSDKAVRRRRPVLRHPIAELVGEEDLALAEDV